MSGQVEGRPMAEIKAILAEDLARFDRLASVWNELTVDQQSSLIARALAMQSENEAEEAS